MKFPAARRRLFRSDHSLLVCGSGPPCINGVDTLIRLFVFESSSLMACLGKSSDSFWWSESNFFVEVPCRIRSKTSASLRRLRCSNFTSPCCLCSPWFAFSSSTICVSFPLVPFVVIGDWNPMHSVVPPCSSQTTLK